jgi:hypothetical protein
VKPWLRGLAATLAAGLLSIAMASSPASASAPSTATSTTGTTGTTGLTPAADPTLPPFAVKIVPGSVIHLVSRSSKLPVSIQNDFPVNIRVQVHVAPNNLSALIPAAIEVTVPANTTYVAQVPVTAIADGDVVMQAWLTTFSGIPLGDPVDLQMTINAEIEESLIGGFVILVAGLGVAGVVRTITKRRRASEAA